MNYWIAEKGNLSECHEPLFDHLSKIYENGQITASVMYNARGFVCHHNTDNWGDTAPQSYSLSSTIWPMGAAWLVLHVYEHYCFTLANYKFNPNKPGIFQWQSVDDVFLMVVD